MNKHHIYYGNQKIEFFVSRKNVKNVNLNVKPDQTVEVSASDEVPLQFIYDLVKDKAEWILKHIQQFEDAQPYERSNREYVSGESFRYLGKQYRLRVRETDEEEIVKYFRGFIYCYVKDVDNYQRKAKLMYNWYRRRAKKIYQESLHKQ